MKVNVKLKGVTPYLFNRFLISSIEEKSKKKTSKDLNIEDKLYKTSDGAIYVPEIHIIGMLINAGKNFQIAGRRKQTYSKFMGSMIETNPIAIPITPQKWDILTVSGVNPNTKGRVLIERPKMDNWELKFEVNILDDDTIDESTLNQLFVYGGKFVGLGDWRPEKKGKYGKFIVTEFKI